jgi:beta-mannosidase
MRKALISILIASFLFFSLIFIQKNFLYAGEGADASTITRLPLEGEWQFRQGGQAKWYKATVPGCVHTDLMANGLIPDPYYRDNELKVQWVERENWEYRKEFFIPETIIGRNHVELVCKGLDTYAKVFINGNKVAETDNMFRGYRFEVKPFMKQGKNEIAVLLDSPVNWEKALEDKLPYKLPGNCPFTRKAHYHFGWDWGPRLTTSGIWRPIYIEAWDTVRFEELEIGQEFFEKNTARLNLRLEILSDKEQQAEIKAVALGKKKEFTKNWPVSLKKGLNNQHNSLEIANPELWWPAGMGEQNLYTVKIQVLQKGKELDSISKRIGLRTLSLEQNEDQWGKSFQFVVNGIPFFAKGGNWIPADVFLNRVTPQKYQSLLKDCVEAKMNMLRVWGGGIYEAPEFYDLCDELGLTVWQDFMFACGMYPGDEAYLENVKAEAEFVIKELRHHPCLALWCGNNECEEGWFYWGWKQSLPPKVWEDYEKIFHQILPEAVKACDVERTYWPSSPHSEKTGDPRSDKSGDMHYWGIWHGKEPFKEYREKFHRFFSEFGFQSFPLIETVKTYTLPEDRNITSPVMEQHQKHPEGNRLIIQYMLDHYRLPKDFESLLWLSQVLQAEGMKIAAEHFRSQMPRIMGSLYWQIEDCWQVASWSGIDYFGNWKALHYYAKRFYNPLLVAAIDSEKVLNVYGISDLSQPVDAELRWQVRKYEGEVIAQDSVPLRLEPRTSRIVLTKNLDELRKDAAENEAYFYCELVKGDKALSSNIHHFSELKRVYLPHPEIKSKVSIQGKKILITLESAKFAKDVFLAAPGFKGRFSDNFFDMIPGKKYEVEFLADEQIDLSGFDKSLNIISLRDSY